MICWPGVPLNHPLVGLVFTLNIPVVLKHMDVLNPILNLKHFNHYMHIPTFQMFAIIQVWLLIWQGDYVFFLLVSGMLIYIFLLLSITITFYGLLGNTNLINGRFCLLGWLWPLWFPPCSLNMYCSFAVTRILCYYLLWWYPSPYLFLVYWGESLNFLVLSLGSSWIT